ncbi:MAG: MurT ligase domain-containing protein [Dehalococcoidia bacterium]|jgi:hypothetical protein|nr:MurT ligase domain-containing protein [Dehalococcoidia bacterium]
MQREPTLRERGALLAGRGAGEAVRRLGRGGGTALPGLIAGALAPGLVEALGAQLGQGSVTVTGTNGKTTTTRLLAEAVRRSGLEPVTNHSGSNLERGLVSAYVDEAGPDGVVPDPARSLGVLEVDEAALASLLPRLRPRVAVFLNLFRDQLDRYGEVDSVAEGWRDALLRLSGEVGDSGDGDTTLVLNADDPTIATLGEVARGPAQGPGQRPTMTFGIEDRSVALPGVEHAADARFCLCGEAFEYEAVYMGHVGVWRCDSCGRRRAEPDVAARDVELMADSVSLQLDLRAEGPGRTLQIDLPFAGLYSVYNALGAAAAAHALGLPAEAIADALEQAGPAFGRQERFTVDGRHVRLLLAKNPTSMNEVARAIAGATLGSDGPSVLLAILNDGIADGRDVSWIYDADLEQLVDRTGSVVASGTRADDMALRLVLAGVEPAVVEPDIAAALEQALAITAEGGWLEVMPTYTAMLEVRELLATRTGAAPFWRTAEPAAPDAPEPSS